MMRPEQHLLRIRLDMAEALVRGGGAEVALQVLMRGSIEMAPIIADDPDYGPTVWDDLQGCAERLGLVRAFGQDVVQAALCVGPQALSARMARRAAA